MVNWNLLRCAFGKHEYGGILHYDMIDRWIKICKHCGAIVKVKAPEDENGKPVDPHVWLRTENERTEAEMQKMLTKTM